jgi:hypothetical protein
MEKYMNMDGWTDRGNGWAFFLLTSAQASTRLPHEYLGLHKTQATIQMNTSAPCDW